MANISKAAALSKNYTNHSLRSTSITTLDVAGFEGREIKTMSKHKCLESIEKYTKDTSIPKKKKMSATLSNALYNESTEVAVHVPQRNNENNPPSVNLANALPEPVIMDDLDLLDDSILLSPDVDRVLNEINNS